MERSFRRCFWFYVLATAGLFVNDRVARAQVPDRRVEKIFADWQRRQERIQSIRYQVRGEMVRPKGSIIKPDNPPREISCAVRRMLLLDWPTNRHRLEMDDELYSNLDSQIHPDVFTNLFDGSFYKARRPREANPSGPLQPTPNSPDINIAWGDLKNVSFEEKHWPLFIGHGVIVTLDERIVPGKLKVKLDAEMFHVHGTGVHRGRSCLVLRTHARRAGSNTFYEEFWVDVERDSAVVQQLRIGSGRSLFDFDIQYQRTSHGWLPERWTFTVRDGSDGKTLYFERIGVQEILINLPIGDADFQLEQKPGMLIAKSEFGKPKIEPKYFRVSEDSQLEEVFIKHGIERKAVPSWIWSLPLLLAGGAFAVWVIRRWKRHRFPSAG